MSHTESNTSLKIRLLLAGGIAGATAKTVVAPLERIRILYQTGHAKGGLRQITREIHQAEGVRGFWRGNFINCLRVFPSRGILFSVNDTYKKLFAVHVNGKFLDEHGEATEESIKSLPMWMSFLAGSLSGVTATIITYPMDVVRTRMSGKFAKNFGYSSTNMFSQLMTMAKDEGLRSWYRGVGPTLLGALPYEGIKFAVFDTFMNNHPEVVDEIPQLMIPYKLLAGACAGAFAGICLYPNDTIRRLIQIQGSPGVPIEYTSTWDCWKKTYKNHGIRRFYRGLFPYLLRMVPNSAITFGTFEAIKGILV